MIAMFWDLCWKAGCALIRLVPSDREHNRVSILAAKDEDRVVVVVVGTRAAFGAIGPVVDALSRSGE